jgi:beta-N-acetylhexosaminidase
MQRRSIKRHLIALGGAFLMLSALFFPSGIYAAPGSQSTNPRVDALLDSMTLTQQVSQLFMVSLWGEVLTLEGRAFLETYQPGGVSLFGYNTSSAAQITTLTNDIQTTITAQPGAAPAWIAIDQEGGTVSRLSGAAEFTSFPVSMTVAATNDPAYGYAIGAALAEELRAVGINMNLAPVADVETNPNNPVIYRRAFSSDATLTARMVAAEIAGMQANGVLATAKHFPGHGETDTDSHLTLPVVELDRARIDAVELVPFREAISANVGAIMAGHLVYPALDSTPDMPASLSPLVLDDLLRGELGYDGMIMTDALDMDAIDQRYTLSQAAVMTIQAGADLVTPGPHVSLRTQQAAIEAVIEAVENGTISRTRITDSARRILTLKAQYGVLDWTPLDPASAVQRINRDAHEALIADLFRAAVTVAYDQTDLIPFAAETRVALVYPATQPSIARTCEAYHPDLWLVGVSTGPTDEERAWASSAAQWADAVIVMTSDAHLNRPMQALVNSLPPEKTVVVALRSPYDWTLFPDIAAYALTYSPLPAAYPAVCGGLFGAQPVTGVLPITLDPALPAGSGMQITPP